MNLCHAVLFQFPGLLDELVGPRPHAIVFLQESPIALINARDHIFRTGLRFAQQAHATFAAFCGAAQDVSLFTVSPVVITKYFTGIVAGRWKRTTVSFYVLSLRSCFRHARSRGWCAAGLAESIDAPRVYTYETLPQGPAWEEMKKLVTSVNVMSPVQITSRCAILLCSVYGQRVGEVCCLRLEEIDWAEERISVRRPKQRKAQTYPLTTEVGNALLRYLKEVRPQRPHQAGVHARCGSTRESHT